MLILITRHKKVFFEKKITNIEHDVKTSKIPFLSLLPREGMSRYFFLKTLFMYARSIPVQKKVHLINSQFLVVTFDKIMGVLNCAFNVV